MSLRKNSFLESMPLSILDSQSDQLTVKCKFNFSYIDFSQGAGQSFDQWSKKQLIELLDKLKCYSGEALKHWMKTPIGSGKKRGQVLAVYGKFPSKSDFIHPKYIPADVRWARFRLESDSRLVGFIIPEDKNGTLHSKTKQRFDSNTFYVVFLDEQHKFYKSK